MSSVTPSSAPRPNSPGPLRAAVPSEGQRRRASRKASTTAPDRYASRSTFPSSRPIRTLGWSSIPAIRYEPWVMTTSRPRPGRTKESAAASTAESRIAAITRDATAGVYDAYRMEVGSMIVRSLDEVTGTERDVHGEGWRSQRLLLRRDGLGFSLHNTTVAAGAEMELEYR